MPKGGPPTPIKWIILVLLTMLAILWECLLIAGCAPPIPGNPSLLSEFHLMELTAGPRSVRFGYISFCSLGVLEGKATQICSPLDSLTNPSPTVIASKLPNVISNPLLFNSAFFMNRTVFPLIPAVSLAFLTLSAFLLIGHWMVRNKNPRQAKMIMLGIFACLGISLTMALVSAVSVTLTTAAIANMTALNRVGYIAVRGETAFRLHWVAFANILLVFGACSAIVPKAGAGGIAGGGQYYDQGYDQQNWDYRQG